MCFLIKTEIKADTKLTVVRPFQIFDRKSTVPSNGDFLQETPRSRPVDKIRNFKEQNNF